MSYINRDGEAIKRRHPRRNITGAEAVAKLNQMVDEHNARVARIERGRQIYEDAARVITEENEKLVEALRTVLKAKSLGDAKGIANAALKAWEARKL